MKTWHGMDGHVVAWMNRQIVLILLSSMIDDANYEL